MTKVAKSARIVGILYLLDILVAPFRLIYIPKVLFVSGNATVTANNILAHESLFRLGIVSDLLCGVIEIFLVLALYQLLKHINRKHAVLMVVLGLMTVPLFFVNVLNDAAALVLVRGTEFLSVFDKSQRDALAMLFLHLHRQENVACEIFWGLWLLPLAALVYRSHLLPRFLGVWLAINGLAYLALSAVSILWPQYEGIVSTYIFPAQLGEIAFMLWLLIMGAKPRPSAHSDFASNHSHIETAS
ncbi:MAG TPA: DUF4386 domain-containing protein [Oleiagrimonas sp.]|nr:DUF4386 domain-containing protein [Oleiagrimonas sp.]